MDRAPPGSRELKKCCALAVLLQDHTNALQLVSKFLSDTFAQSFTEEVHSVGHRVVHGREISDSMLIT